MIERIEKIEKEIEVIRYAYEQNKLFLESENEAKDAYVLFNKTILEFMKDTNEKILDLQNSFVLISKNNALHFQLIESQGRTIKTLTETLEALTKNR